MAKHPELNDVRYLQQATQGFCSYLILQVNKVRLADIVWNQLTLEWFYLIAHQSLAMIIDTPETINVKLTGIKLGR